MDRNYGNEIDALKAQLDAIQSTLNSLTGAKAKHGNQAAPENASPRFEHQDERVNALMDEIIRISDENGDSGRVGYLGFYRAAGNQSMWSSFSTPADVLLELIESGLAGKVLACIGNETRLRILLAILRGPKTVSEIVEACSLGSTGQAYHHMQPLVAADLIYEDENQRGKYLVRPHRVQGIIMMLAGINDMLDDKYTDGRWTVYENPMTVSNTASIEADFAEMEQDMSDFSQKQ